MRKLWSWFELVIGSQKWFRLGLRIILVLIVFKIMHFHVCDLWNAKIVILLLSFWWKIDYNFFFSYTFLGTLLVLFQNIVAVFFDLINGVQHTSTCFSRLWIKDFPTHSSTLLVQPFNQTFSKAISYYPLSWLHRLIHH